MKESKKYETPQLVIVNFKMEKGFQDSVGNNSGGNGGAPKQSQGNDMSVDDNYNRNGKGWF